MASALDTKRQDIKALLEEGWTKTAIARKFGVARSTLGTYLDNTGLSASVVTRELEEGISEHEKMKDRLKELEKRVRGARTDEVQYQRVIDAIENTATAVEPSYEAPEFTATNDHRPHVQVLLLSDTHAGEVVDAEAVNGMNEYSWEIMETRMARILRSLKSYVNTRTYEIEELQIWVLGDMLSGDNHDELTITNEIPIAEAAHKFGVLLGQWIEELVPLYPKITVYAVPGNHPRTTKKPAAKQVFNNWDWVSYLFAKTHLSQYESVEFNTTRSAFIVAEVAGRNALLWHGDGIRSTMPGVPWGGVMRRVNEMRRQYHDQGTDIEYFALGHFHQANIVQGKVFMNGSIKGPDEYSLKQFGSSEQPRQLLLTFDPRKERPTDVSFIDP